jgi:Flp pilus assembly protein TadG
MAAIVTRRKNPRRRWDEGAAAVEAALVLPVLFLFIFGIIEFGRAVWQWNTMLLAVEQAGRYVMVNYNNSTNCPDLVACAEREMQAVLSGASVCPTPMTPTSGQMCVNAAPPTAGTPPTMTLAAAYNFNPVSFFQPFTITSQGTVPLD